MAKIKIPKYDREYLDSMAHEYAVNTLISRYYPEYENIKKKRMEVLFKLNSSKS